jgi:hypothetical protein
MSNQHLEMTHIRRLIGAWINEIEINSHESYTDINKVSEHFCRQLMNLVYDYELEDLNLIQTNYPGLDIGDQKKSMVAYQVTSRVDNKKIIECLKMVVKHKANATFTNGIRFLILNNADKVSFGPKAKKTPSNVLPTFKLADDVVYPHTIARKIQDIYETEGDLIKFNRIKTLLEREIIPILSGKPAAAPSQDQQLAELLKKAMEQLSKNENTIQISPTFLHGSTQVPATVVAATRDTYTSDLVKLLDDHDAIWLQGAAASGKSSIAILVSRKMTDPVYWLECRDIPVEQVTEHLLNCLLGTFQEQPAINYDQTLELIFSKISPGSLLALNDLPDFHGSISLQDQLAAFILHATARGILILATSNFHLPGDVITRHRLDILPLTVPPLDEADTEEIFQYLGAEKVKAELLSRIVTIVTGGHPLLVQSAGKYLQEKKWSADKTVIESIFTGKFGDDADKESYARILRETTDAETRVLLYRLRLVLGSFTIETAETISACGTSLTKTAEKIHSLKGTWIEDDGQGNLQLSPLVKRLDGNIDAECTKQIYAALGIQITAQSDISQIDASKAIYYYQKAGKNNSAAMVLLRVLTVFADKPQLVYDWGFNMFWWNEIIPEDVAAFFKVQLRVLQITAAMGLGKDTRFLKNDLNQILAREEVGMLGKASANMLFFRMDYLTNPIKAFRHLAIAFQEFKKMDEAGIPEGETFINDKMMDGIWILFSQIHAIEDYREWFQIFDTLQIAGPNIDHHTNGAYAMAAVSIYRNGILKNKQEGKNPVMVLEELIALGEKSGLQLLSVYAIKWLVKYFCEESGDITRAVSLVEANEQIWNKDPIFHFLIHSELGRRYFYRKEFTAANYYLNGIEKIDIPSFYGEKIDYLTTYLQSSFYDNPSHSAELSEKTLSIIRSLKDHEILMDDRVKLFGEAAIGKMILNEFTQALDLLAEGYTLLLDNYLDTEEHQASVIRYGNAVKYVSEILEYGNAPSFGSGLNVIPEPGFFYRTNTDLLAGGYYFDERKFIVAAALLKGYEVSSQPDKAGPWAYQCFQLAVQLKDPKYVAVLMGDLFYMIKDRNYRMAFKTQAYIDDYYKRIKEKIANGEAVDSTVEKMMETISVDDVGVYFFVLVPIAMSFSLDVALGRVGNEQYSKMISEALEKNSYPFQNQIAFDFTKRLFEKILVDGITVDKMKELISDYTGDFKDIIYIIGSILVAGTADAKTAMQLILDNIMLLNPILSNAKGMYNFFFVPYIETLLKAKIASHPGNFTGKDHLMTKGYSLIDKAPIDQKIKTLLRIFTDHLPVNISVEMSRFLDTD